MALPAASPLINAAILEIQKIARTVLQASSPPCTSAQVHLDEDATLANLAAVQIRKEWSFMETSSQMAFGAPQPPSPPQGSSPANSPLLQTRPSAAPAAAPPADDEIRQRQKKFLILLGGLFFHHYVKVLAPPLATNCLQSLAKAVFVKEASTLYVQALHFPNPAPAPPQEAAIPKGVISAYSFFDCQLEALTNWLGKTIRDDERQDFAELMINFVLPHLTENELNENDRKLAEEIFARLVPDVLYAALQSCRSSDNKLRRFALSQAMLECMNTKLKPSGNLYVDQLTSLLGPIMLLMPHSIECGLKTLFERLSDPTINELIAKSFQERLLKLFFPDPGTLSPKLKHIIVHMLKEVYHLLHTLNTSKANADNVRLDPKTKANNITQALLQNLCMNHKLFSSNTEENNVLEKALENLFWKLLYPEIKKERTPLQQLYVLAARTVAHMGLNQLLDPYTLHCLIKRLLKQKISLQNPFERPSTVKKRPNLEPAFSKELDDLIPKILAEIVNFKTDNGLLRTIGNFAGKFILPKGDDIQTALIDLSESDAVLLPAIVLTQFCYLMEPYPNAANPTQEELCKRFFESLGRKRPAIDPKRHLEADVDQKAHIQEKVHKKIMENTKELEELLKDLPIGTSMAIDLIQKIYLLIKDPAMSNIVASYIVVGATKGLECHAALPKNAQSATNTFVAPVMPHPKMEN